MAACSENFIVDDCDVVLVIFHSYQTVLRQLRRSLQLKKIITIALCEKLRNKKDCLLNTHQA